MSNENDTVIKSEKCKECSRELLIRKVIIEALRQIAGGKKKLEALLK